MQLSQSLVLAGDGPASRGMVLTGGRTLRSSASLPTTFYADSRSNFSSAVAGWGRIGMPLAGGSADELQQLFAANPNRRMGQYVDVYA